MKTFVFNIFLLLPLLFIPVIQAQTNYYLETDYFSYSKSGNSGTVFLFTRNNGFMSQTTGGAQIAISKPRELALEIQKFLREQFPSLTEEEKNFLKNTTWRITITADKRCNSSYFMIDSAYVYLIPIWEKRLYDMTESFKEIDFSPYGLQIPYPEAPERNSTNMSVPFRWIWNEIPPYRNKAIPK